MDTVAELDRRARRSQRLMGDALLVLLLERGYDAVTIKDITERADVAYVAFFRHYDSKQDLLRRRLSDELQDLNERIDAAARAVHEKRALYRALLSTPGALPVRRHVQATIAAIFLASCRPLHESPVATAEIAAHHMAASLLTLIEWWLEHDLAPAPDHMACIYERLIVAGTLAAIVSSRAS